MEEKIYFAEMITYGSIRMFVKAINEQDAKEKVIKYTDDRYFDESKGKEVGMGFIRESDFYTQRKLFINELPFIPSEKMDKDILDLYDIEKTYDYSKASI